MDNFFLFQILNFFSVFFPLVLQLSWNRGGWGWTTSFRGLPQIPTPASSEYHLTHVIVLHSLGDEKHFERRNQKCQSSALWGNFVTFQISWFLFQNFRGHMFDALLFRWTKFELFVFFYSPEVQSILNLSPPQDAELMNTNPSPPVSTTALSFLCLHCTIMQRFVHISSVYRALCGPYNSSCVLILCFLAPPSPPLTAQSIPTDQPRSILKPLSQTQWLPLPQGDRQGQLRQGPACTPPCRWWVLCSQSLTEKGHSQEEGGKCTWKHSLNMKQINVKSTQRM